MNRKVPINQRPQFTAQNTRKGPIYGKQEYEDSVEQQRLRKVKREQLEQRREYLDQKRRNMELGATKG